MPGIFQKKPKKPKPVIEIGEIEILEVEEADSSVSTTATTKKCPCASLANYLDPMNAGWADWEITNCGGLAFRQKNKWMNLVENEPYPGKRIHPSTRREIDVLNHGVRYYKNNYGQSSSEPCAIQFWLWVISNPSGIGFYAMNKKGDISTSPIQPDNPYQTEDFHIVSGRVDCDNNPPKAVSSTNGHRKYNPPAHPDTWKPTLPLEATGPNDEPAFFPSSLLPFISSLGDLWTGTEVKSLGGSHIAAGQPIIDTELYVKVVGNFSSISTEIFFIKETTFPTITFT